MLLPFGTELLAGLIAELDRWRAELDARVVPRRWSGRLRRAIEAEAIAASTSMEGVPVTVSDTLRILGGDPPDDVAPRDRALVLGYREAMQFVQRRADDGHLEWNRELVVGVQDRSLAGNYAMGAGRLRTGSAWITNKRSGEVVFEPPQHELVPDLVDEMCSTIRANPGWHPAVLAAWVHVATAAIHPFADGNGRTARVLASLAMSRGGFRHAAFTNLEEWWGKHPQSYYDAFGCLGRTFSREADVTPFMLVHIQAQVSQVLALALRQRAEGRLWTTLENTLEDLGLPPRLANALYDSFFGREVTTAYYRDLIDASPATARNDLLAAAAAGLLRVEGRTRGRRYVPGPRLMTSIASELGDVEPDAQAIINELVRRSAGAMDWFADAPTSSGEGQAPLSGLG